jgi:hypothetical protein
MSIKFSSGQVIQNVKLLEVDNLRIDNNTISSTNVNGDIILDPNGSGNVVVSSGLLQFTGGYNTSVTYGSVGTGLQVQGPNPPEGSLFPGPLPEYFELTNDQGYGMPTPWTLTIRKLSYDDANLLVISPVVTKYDVENLKFSEIKADNIKIDNNTISSSNTNGDIILDPEGTGNVKILSGNLVLDAGSKIIVGNSIFSSSESLGENIVSTVSIGAISPGNTLTVGSNLTTILKALLQKIYYPTISQPSGSISATAVYTGTATGSTTAKVEIGTNTRVLLTGSFTQGQILGKNNASSGVWESGTRQNYTDGGLQHYILNGINTGATSTNTISNVTIVGSSNTWTGTMFYKSGPQPTDSTGANYLSPLAAGNTTTYTSSAISGIRAYFYGTSTSINTAPTTSSDIRNNYTASVAWSNATNGYSQAVSIPAGTRIVVFAYPATLQNLTSVTDPTGVAINSDAFGQYSSPGVQSSTSPYSIGINGASNYVSATYKVYVYIPAGAIVNSSTYTFTI